MRTVGRVVLLSLMGAAAGVIAREPCQIEVVEKGNGWPVPLVHLSTTHQAEFITDNRGIVAFDLPELMGKETWFHIRSDGYEVPKDGFGYRGVRLTPRPGAKLKIVVERRSIAKRIGRLTGAGLLAESQKLKPDVASQETGVLGCDSVQVARHRGKLYWFWGDTTLARYPLGVFHMTGATTKLNPLRVLTPPLRLNLDQFIDEKKRPRALASIDGSGPTWLSAVASLPDQSGVSRLVASYAKITPPLSAYERGLCLWTEQLKQFERLRVVWKESEKAAKAPPMPDGHALPWTDEEGADWILFGNPLPVLKVPATFEGWRNPKNWQVVQAQEKLRSAADGSLLTPHSGSIAWNAYRKRWVTVFLQKFGKPSAFGELWYAEARSPLGPWGDAVKVLSHSNYTFYNPRVHPELTPSGSPVLLFEGTYTTLFADRPKPTPRYDYNQILYRLDLDDPALARARKGVQ